MWTRGVCVLVGLVLLTGCARDRLADGPCPFSNEWVNRNDRDSRLQAIEEHLATQGGEWDREPQENMAHPGQDPVQASSGWGMGMGHMDGKDLLKAGIRNHSLRLR